MKKIICLALVFFMLATLIPATVSAEPIEYKSVEEILDNYHSRITAINQNDTNNSTYSLNAIREKNQIKQETMDELASQGYSAYDVNASTYDSVENALQTDLSVLGIDPEGSYIVVISGEPADNNGVAPTAVTPPPGIDDDPNSFSYTYEGEVYRLRYLTIFAEGNYGYAIAESFDLVEGENDPDTIGDYFLTAASIIVDQIFDEYQYFGTLLSICGLEPPSPTYIRDLTMEYHAGTNWTRTFTQVWFEDYDEWRNGSCVEYVTNFSYVTGIFYDRTLNRYTTMPGKTAFLTTYSNCYNSLAWRKENAVTGFLWGSCRFDRTGPVKYYHGNTLLTIHSFSGVPY